MITRFIWLFILFSVCRAADSVVGCYASIPDSWVSKGTGQYQSSAYCSNKCSEYAYFAMTNGNECYCGNTEPTEESSDCNLSCPGYPSDTCGGDDSYSVYSNDDVSPDSSASSSSSGTSSEPSSSESSSSTPLSSATSSSSDSTSSAETTADEATSSATPSSTASPTTTSSSSSSSVTTTSPVVSKITSTVSQSTGGYVTSVIYITHTASPTSVNDEDNDSKKKSSNAAVIGGAVGGTIGGLAILFAVFFLFCWRRRRSSGNGYNSNESSVVDDLAYEEALKVDNPFADEFRMTDQRLNPVMLDRRRLSEGSLADAADYSRKILRVANPDGDD